MQSVRIEPTASEYLAYVSAEDSDEEAQAWKEALEEQFYTQTDENTEYTYWFYAIGEDKIAHRCREAGQSVGQKEELIMRLRSTVGVSAVGSRKADQSIGDDQRGWIFLPCRMGAGRSTGEPGGYSKRIYEKPVE